MLIKSFMNHVCSLILYMNLTLTLVPQTQENHEVHNIRGSLANVVGMCWYCTVN